MNYETIPYRIFPLGDSALTLDFGDSINETLNKQVVARFKELQKYPLPGMIEAVPAYSSLTIYYDLPFLKRRLSNKKTVFEWVKEQLEERLQHPVEIDTNATTLVRIPVCYEDEYAPDILQLSDIKNIPVDEVIRIHTAIHYKVYMLGFLPGFAYMGEVDERIAMPRKPQPEKVAEGSVGIAGIQTGIYPLSSPGGWQIIGRTPLKLFKAPPNLPEGEAFGERDSLKVITKVPTLLNAGDTVQFYPIDKKEFEEIIATEAQKH